MKKILFFVIILAVVSSANSQQLLFKVNQTAEAYKNSKTGKFVDAEVNDLNATILLHNNQVIFEGDTKGSYKLNKKAIQNKINPNVISYKYTGQDEKEAPITFVYTVNLHSKEVVIEVADNDSKNYYFGSYSSPDLTTQR